jgi:ERF superfamily
MPAARTPRATTAKTEEKAAPASPPSEPTPPPRAILAAKIARVQHEMRRHKLEKTGTHQQGWQYIQEHKVFERLDEKLTEEKLAVIVSTADVYNFHPALSFGKNVAHYVTLRGHVEVICGDTGESVEATYFGEGADTQDRAAGKAQTYLVKYALQKFFHIPTDEVEDSDRIDPAAAQAPASTGAAPTPAPSPGPAPSASPSSPQGQAAAQPGVQSIGVEAGGRLAAALGVEVNRGHLDGNKVKAKLSTYRVDDLALLTEDQAVELHTWASAEVEKAKAQEQAVEDMRGDDDVPA